MRTQLELWQVVKDNFDEYFYEGIISMDEKNCIHAEIKKYGNTKDYFLGEPKDPKPRLKFIEKIIKKHSQ